MIDILKSGPQPERMKKKSGVLPTLCCLSFCSVLCCTAISNSYAIDPTVVAPNGLRDVEGNKNNQAPFNISPNQISMRYQQLYQASQFGIIGAGALITQIIFRPDGPFGQAFNSVLPDMQIDLSTVGIADDGLSLTFANNVGADDTIVFSGPLSLSSANAGGMPKDFDIVINLTTPFFYDPSMGNLLLDVRNFGGGNTTVFDAQSTGHDGVCRVSTNVRDGVDHQMADFGDTYGLVTGFTLSANALLLTNVASEKEGFDVILPGIECRSGNSNMHYSIIFTFNHTITSIGGANTSCGTVTSRTIDSTDPHRVIVNLRDVSCDQENVSINLANVTDDQGNNLSKTSTEMTLLAGDVTADGVVDQADVQEIQQHKGELLDESNFRSDVNVDGHISFLDVKLVRSLGGLAP